MTNKKSMFPKVIWICEMFQQNVSNIGGGDDSDGDGGGFDGGNIDGGDDKDGCSGGGVGFTAPI